MRWTWRATFVGLSIAILLGAPALAFDWRQRAARKEIMASGQRVAGRVTGSGGSPAVEYVADGHLERVEITDVWGETRAGDWITVYYLPGQPRRMASPDGVSTLSGNAVPFIIAPLAFVVVFVSVTGRATTAYREWSRPVRIRRPRVRKRRDVVRRNDWISRIILGLGLAGVAGSLWADNALEVTAAFMSPLVVGGYIMGVSRKVTVTPAELLVYNAFNVIWIPRHLITKVMVKGGGFVGIVIAGHRTVDVPVGLSRLYERGDDFDRSRAQVRTIMRLDAVLAQIPQEANSGDPGVRHRWTTIAALAASLSAFAWLTIEVFTGRIG